MRSTLLGPFVTWKIQEELSIMMSSRVRQARPTGRSPRRTFLTKAAFSGISAVAAFGSNPGTLRMLVYAPSRLRAGLVVTSVPIACAIFSEPVCWYVVITSPSKTQ
jgi:hypothetical protein